MTCYKARGTVGLEVKSDQENMVYFTPAASSTVEVGTQKYAVFLATEGEESRESVVKPLDEKGRVQMSLTNVELKGSTITVADVSKVISWAILLSAILEAAVSKPCFDVVVEKSCDSLKLVGLDVGL